MKKKKFITLYCIITSLLLIAMIVVMSNINLTNVFSTVTQAGSASVTNTKNNTSSKTKENITINPTTTIHYTSPLNITLTGHYNTINQNAIKNLTTSTKDIYKQLIVKIGLQILQSETISYIDSYNFYSLSYTGSGGTKNAKYYSLTECINRINDGKTIYTDCFGFVRLTYSIACYAINKTHPEQVSGLNNLYGYKGGYGVCSNIGNTKNMNTGCMIADRLTGSTKSTSGSKTYYNRHVAIYLYTSGNTITYMDQGGIKTGIWTNGYILTQRSNKDYKFNQYYNYV